MDQDFIPPRSSSRSNAAVEAAHFPADQPAMFQRLPPVPATTSEQVVASGASDGPSPPSGSRRITQTFDPPEHTAQPTRQSRERRPIWDGTSDAHVSSARNPTGYRTTTREVLPGLFERSDVPILQRSDSSDSSTNRKRGVSNASDNTFHNKRTNSIPQASSTYSNRQSSMAGSSARNAIDLTGTDDSSRPSASLRSFTSQPTLPRQSRGSIQLPPWQPDNDVSQCPVCGTAFGFLYRKHHCRKCGKVVCDNCSRHRIGLPRQYIVHPPPGVSTSPFSSTFSALGVSASLQVGSSQSQFYNSARANGNDRRLPESGQYPFGGAEVVRVCKPCVPDPNLSPPPQTPVPADEPPSYPNSISPSFVVPVRSPPSNAHRRQDMSNYQARNAARVPQPPVQIPERRGSGLQGFGSSNALPVPPMPTGNEWHSFRGVIPSAAPSAFQQQQQQQQRPQPRRATLASERPLPSVPTATSQAYRQPISIPSSDRIVRSEHGAGSQPRGFPQPHRPPRREIPEEDECPVCGNELPPIAADGSTKQREEHVEQCIQVHSFVTSTPAATAPISGSAPPSRFANLGEGAASSDETRERTTSNSTGQSAQPRPSSLSSLPAAEASSSVPAGDIQEPGASQHRTRANRMIVYRASEKDCLGEDGEPQECVICFEEFEPGHEMGRLECWCKFHRLCIRKWWETKGPGSCPTHQLHW